MAYLVDENYTLKRLELDFRFDSYYWKKFANRYEYYQSVIKDLAHSSKIVDLIAASKVLHNIDISITDTYIWDENHTLADRFEPLVQAIATAKGWCRDERMYKCSYGKMESVKHEWVWHLWAPITARS